MRKCSQQQFGIACSFWLARTQVAGRVLQDGSGSEGGDAPIVVIGSDTIVDVRVGDVGGLRHTLVNYLFSSATSHIHIVVSRGIRVVYSTRVSDDMALGCFHRKPIWAVTCGAARRVFRQARVWLS